MSHQKTDQANTNKNPDLVLEGIKHADTGYKNAQDIIKFIDAKAGVIAGFAFIGIAVILQAIKEFLDFDKSIQVSVSEAFKPHAVWVGTILCASFLSMAVGIFCVLCVVRCITARPPSVITKLKYSFLFPFYDGTKEIEPATAYYSKLQAGLTPKEIAKEYEMQILNVGAILHKKMKWLRKAANAFLWQLGLLAVTGVIIFTCSVEFIRPAQSSAEPAVSGSVSNTLSTHLPGHVPNSPTSSSNP